MEKLDVVIIGAGVIGLAIARSLALQGREVIILEKNKTYGEGVSSRNSEVIHAGIYYQPGSLKARSCVLGKKMLYAYCKERQIPHSKTGKLIVACNEKEISVLDQYIGNAKKNGVQDLHLLTAAETTSMEPNIRCLRAIYSPSTGIIDSHSLMLNFIADIEAHGGIVVYNSPVLTGYSDRQFFTLSLGGSSTSEVMCNLVINTAGLNAIDIAQKLGVDPVLLPKPYMAKGHYFTMSGASPFNHLVYPIANEAGLGIHATLDLNGQVKFGPDVEWIEEEDYNVDDRLVKKFAQSIKQYYPDLNPQSLHPTYAGIRPKIVGQGEPAADFCIQWTSDHGIGNLVNLFGIESPGLTASLAIAEYVTKRVSASGL